MNADNRVPPASAPAATAELIAPKPCVCGHQHEWGIVNGEPTVLPACRAESDSGLRCSCRKYQPAAPTGEEAETPDAILTDAVIGAFYDAANDTKQDAGGSLFYRWNDPTPAWQEGIGKAFFRDFALRIAGHVASRYATEYTTQATALAALRARYREACEAIARKHNNPECACVFCEDLRAALAPHQTTGGEHG